MIYAILDNFATHKTDLVKEFLAEHPNVQLHFIPTYSSWLNQVERCFSKLQRDFIDLGIFMSVNELKRKILRCIKLYQKSDKTLPLEILRSFTLYSRLVAMPQGQPTNNLSRS